MDFPQPKVGRKDQPSVAVQLDGGFDPQIAQDVVAEAFGGDGDRVHGGLAEFDSSSHARAPWLAVRTIRTLQYSPKPDR